MEKARVMQKQIEFLKIKKKLMEIRKIIKILVQFNFSKSCRPGGRKDRSFFLIVNQKL